MTAEIYAIRRRRFHRTTCFLLSQFDWEHREAVRWSYKDRRYHRRIASQSVIDRSLKFPNSVSDAYYNLNLRSITRIIEWRHIVLTSRPDPTVHHRVDKRAIDRLPERSKPEAPQSAITASFAMTNPVKKSLARRVIAGGSAASQRV